MKDISLLTFTREHCTRHIQVIFENEKVVFLLKYIQKFSTLASLIDFCLYL